MDDFSPKVSIVIPVYNGANYMREAIDSALTQTYKNIEVIVVNDGSTDITEEIALSYGNKIKYFYKENGGQSSALNMGIEKMDGAYFSWLSHDDKYYPEKLETQIKILQNLENKETILFSGYSSIDSKGKYIRSMNDRLLETKTLTWYLIRYNAINGNTVLIPKNVFEAIGLFRTDRPHTSDVWMFFCASRKFPVKYIATELILSRTHLAQATYRRYSYHLYEINNYLIDCLNSLSNQDLVSISHKSNINFVLEELAISWSKAGHLTAYKLVLKRLLLTTDINKKKWYKISLECKSYFILKILKRNINRLKNNY